MYVDNVINPFAKTEAEEYKREQIYNFYNRNDEITKRFKERKHQFIWGARGSGKSTLLRFFEPYCQFKEYGGWEKFFSLTDAFISFYCPIPKAIVNISDFKNSNVPAKDIIFCHYFNMLFAESIVTTLQEQLDQVERDDSLYNEFYDFFITLFDKHDSIVASTTKEVTGSDLSSIEKVLILISNEKVHANSFCSLYGLNREYEYYAGSLTNYHNFLLPLVKQIRQIYKLPVPIFISIDDAGFLMDNVQEHINSWIANRNKCDLVIKIASDPLEYKTFSTVEKKSIRRIHDYDDIFLDVPYPGVIKNTYKCLIDIADRRLQYYYRNPISIAQLFPSDSAQDKEIEEAKKKLALNVASINEITDKARYVSRYTMQEFYRVKSKNKETNPRSTIYRTIAGIDDLINLSDYNPRTFLRLCNAIFTERYPNSKRFFNNSSSTYVLEPVSPDIQNKAIKEYSQQEASYISKYKPEYSTELISQMQIFLTSIGTLFRKKLLDFNDKEYGVTGFSTDFSALHDDEKAVIRVAVECGFLLKNSYTSKDSHARIDSYNLSKKLFPYFRLEPKPYAGRININPTILQKAFINSEEFYRSYKSSGSESMQLSFFEEMTVDEDRQNDYSDLF